MNDYPELARRIRAFRKQRGWTQADVAREAVVSAPAVSQAERGKDVSSAVRERIESVMAGQSCKDMLPLRRRRAAARTPIDDRSLVQSIATPGGAFSAKLDQLVKVRAAVREAGLDLSKDQVATILGIPG
jgi:transcriptional regulator with XRE-family HTH domain